MSRRWGIDWVGPTVEPTVYEALAELAPKSELMPWLHLYWEPGDSWCSVERFVLANMVPKAVLRAEHLFYQMVTGETHENASLYSELEGGNPRWLGHYDTIKEKYILNNNVVLPPNITQRQWLLYHETGAYAMPCWIVQGTRGGHKLAYSQIERLLLKQHGHPPDPPVPGDEGYPFAHPDQRMISAMRSADRLRSWAEVNSKDWRLRTSADVAHTKANRQEDYEEAVWKWLEPQVEEPTTIWRVTSRKTAAQLTA